MNTDLMAYVENATRRKLRRDNVPISDHDDCLQNARLHAWEEYERLADKPEDDRVRLSAFRGADRCRWQVTTEPRKQRYQDALDFVHTPTTQEYNEGIVGKWEMARPGRKKYDSCSQTDDELIAEIVPPHLQEYVTHKRLGIPQAEIAAIHNISLRTLGAIYAEVRKRIRQRAAEREAEASTTAWVYEIRNAFAPEADEITNYVTTTDRKPKADKAIPSQYDAPRKPLTEFMARRLGFVATTSKTHNPPLPIMPQATRLADGRILCG